MKKVLILSLLFSVAYIGYQETSYGLFLRRRLVTYRLQTLQSEVLEGRLCSTHPSKVQCTKGKMDLYFDPASWNGATAQLAESILMEIGKNEIKDSKRSPSSEVPIVHADQKN